MQLQDKIEISELIPEEEKPEITEITVEKQKRFFLFNSNRSNFWFLLLWYQF
jgi:hypothetical protein